MKKIYAVLTTLLCIAFFTGCQKPANSGLVNDNGETQQSFQESNIESLETTLAEALEDAQASSSQIDDEPVSVMQAFRSVLLNEAAFFCTDKVPNCNVNVIREYNGLLNEMSQNYVYSEQVCRFAVVDMDGDRTPEVLLELDDYVGYIILRYVDGQIHGNVLGYRSMSSIRENGTFQSEGSAFEGWLQKLYFIGDTVVMDWKVYSLLSAYSELYCIDDISVGKEDYERANAVYEGCPKVAWHDYTEAEVNKFIVENSLFTEASAEAIEKAGKRQAYLDSLSYLIDLTYDYSRKTEEEFHADGKSYYDGCFNELNKIYQLCTEKLTGEALEALVAEQQHWEDENRKIPEEDTLYYEYGDKAFRRVLRLINVYYGYVFYDWTDLESWTGDAETESARMQTFKPEEVNVTPKIVEYDFESACELGEVTQMRGMLPGLGEGTWYTIEISGVEYYYAAYDDFPDKSELFEYAIVSGGYSLANGISVGMTKKKVLEFFPAMAILDAEGNTLNEVVDHMGWNSTAYPRSALGMDEKWDYGGTEYYYWVSQFDNIMIAKIEQESDTLPLYMALMMKNDVVAAITFYYPTAD